MENLTGLTFEEQHDYLFDNFCNQETVRTATKYVFDNKNTGIEINILDTLYFGMGVYADYQDCIRLGLKVKKGVNELYCNVNFVQVMQIIRSLDIFPESV